MARFATSASHYENALRKRGFNELGQGMFSVVYGKPASSRVVKISRRFDCAWLGFMHWANDPAQQWRLQFAPRLYSVKFYEDFYVAVMDRVDHVGYHSDKTSAAVIACLNYGSPRGRDPDLREDNLDLWVWLCELQEAFSGTRIDLHAQNIGWNSDGKIVFFDPLCDFDGSYSAEKFGVTHKRYRSTSHPKTQERLAA